MKTKICKICYLEDNTNNFHGRMCINCFNKSRRKIAIIYDIKICKNCNFIGQKSDFNGSLCFNCEKIRKHNYYIANSDKIKKAAKVWAANNKEKSNISKKLYKQNNKEKILQAGRNYYHNNKNKYIIQSNKTVSKINKKEYKKNRKARDLNFKLRENISVVIRAMIKRNYGNKKGSSFKKYLPYTIEELKIHLEKQFEPWMTWQNWGTYNISSWDDSNSVTWKWNIDHIIPQSKLQYSSMEDDNFKICWALNNLRPLSAKENIIKSDRIIK